jgi:hypothetical protein
MQKSPARGASEIGVRDYLRVGKRCQCGVGDGLFAYSA